MGFLPSPPQQLVKLHGFSVYWNPYLPESGLVHSKLHLPAWTVRVITGCYHPGKVIPAGWNSQFISRVMILIWNGYVNSNFVIMQPLVSLYLKYFKIICIWLVKIICWNYLLNLFGKVFDFEFSYFHISESLEKLHQHSQNYRRGSWLQWVVNWNKSLTFL